MAFSTLYAGAPGAVTRTRSQTCRAARSFFAERFEPAFTTSFRVPACWPRSTARPSTGALAAPAGRSTSVALTVVWLAARPSSATTCRLRKDCREATFIHSTDRVIFGCGAPPPGGGGVVTTGTVTAGLLLSVVVVSVVVSVVSLVVVVVVVVVGGELVLVVLVVVVVGGVYGVPWPSMWIHLATDGTPAELTTNSMYQP